MAIICFRGKYKFLSNFYRPSPVRLDGMEFKTVEHGYQAAKTFNRAERVQIQEADGPEEAKRLGRMVAERQDWDDVKETVMWDLLRQKFAADPLKALLLETRDQELVEGNTWHDRYWGVCICDRCVGAGENRLGIMLVAIRIKLWETQR